MVTTSSVIEEIFELSSKGNSSLDFAKPWKEKEYINFYVKEEAST